MRNGIPNLAALQAFEASARLGSFSRAAEELSLTHSAVYRQVAGLVSRTGMGRSIHIAVVPTLATAWLIPRLAKFQQAYPDITVSLSVRTLPFQFADLPFDGAIYHSDHVWRGTQGVLLFPEGALVPVCAPALMQRFQGKTMPDLSHLTHLHLSSRPDAWRQWYGANTYEYGPQAAGGPRYELFTMMLAAVQAGLGVGLMPQFLAQPKLDEGSLVMPLPHVLTVTQGYYFGYPKREERSEALTVFETWLTSVCA